MKASNTKKYLMTSSNDNCVIIVSAEEKTHHNDVFLSEATLNANIKNNQFIKHETLKYNNQPVYILKEDMAK